MSRSNQGQVIQDQRLVGAVDTATSERAACDWLCDGIDDYKEIQAALDELTSVGGVVRLMAGNYAIGGTQVTIPAGTILQGSGMGTIATGSATQLFELGNLSALEWLRVINGTNHHIYVPSTAQNARLTGIQSVNPGLAHVRLAGDRANLFARRLLVESFSYERPESDGLVDFDLIPQGEGVFSSYGDLTSVQEKLDELLEFKDEATLALGLVGVSI